MKCERLYILHALSSDLSTDYVDNGRKLQPISLL